MDENENGKLTGYGIEALVGSCFELADAFAHCLVPGHERHHAQEAEEQRERRRDLPLAEDYADVPVVPGEEHLVMWINVGFFGGREVGNLTFMLQRAGPAMGMSCMPWSMWWAWAE